MPPIFSMASMFANKNHWLTKMIHFFAYSLLLVLDIRVLFFAVVGSLCSSAIAERALAMMSRTSLFEVLLAGTGTFDIFIRCATQ